MAIIETADKTIGTVNVFDAFNSIFFDPQIMTIPEYIANYFMDFISNFFFVLFFIALIINTYKLVFEGVPFKQVLAGTIFSFLSIYILFYMKGWKDAKTDDGAVYESYFVTDVVSTVFYVGERAADAFAYNILFGKTWTTLKDFKLVGSNGIKKDEKVDGYLFTDFYNKAISKNYSETDKKKYVIKYKKQMEREANKIKALKSFIDSLKSEDSLNRIYEHLLRFQELRGKIDFVTEQKNDNLIYHFYYENKFNPSTEFGGMAYNQDDSLKYEDFIKDIEKNGGLYNSYIKIINNNISELESIKKASLNGIKSMQTWNAQSGEGIISSEDFIKTEFNKFLNRLKSMKDISYTNKILHINQHKNLILSDNNVVKFKDYANEYISMYIRRIKNMYADKARFFYNIKTTNKTFYIPYSYYPSEPEVDIFNQMVKRVGLPTKEGIIHNSDYYQIKGLDEKLKTPAIKKLIDTLDNYTPPINPTSKKTVKTLEDYILAGIPTSVSDKYEFHWIDLGLIYTGVLANIEDTIHIIAGFKTVDVGTTVFSDITYELDNNNKLSFTEFEDKINSKTDTLAIAAGGITGALIGVEGFKTIFAMSSGISKPFGLISGVIGGSIGALLSFYMTIFIVMIVLFIIKTMIPAFFWMIGVLNWFIRSSFLMLLLPVSILFAIFTSRRQALFDNIYKILGQAIVPMVLVATFFLVINAIIVTNLMVKEMVPILDAEKMVNWYSDGIEGNGQGTSFLAKKTQEVALDLKGRIESSKTNSSSLIDRGINFGLDIGSKAFTYIFDIPFIYNALVSLMAYGISILYFLVTLIMDILLLRYFWKIDDIVGEVMGTSVNNNSFDAEQLFRRFGGKFVS